MCAAWLPALFSTLLAGVAWPEAGDSLLEQIRVRMAETLRHIPDYTCLQTIERWRQGDPCAKCQYRERLRLEVAVIGGKERWAWPGAREFEDRGLEQIVPPGAIGTGDFSGFATTIFRTPAASFQGPYPEVLEGRAAWRYDYAVPVERSRYTVRDGRHSAVVGFHGAFWVSRDTLDLLRLDVSADGLPTPPLDIASATTTISYQRTRIGESSFLLPRLSELSLSSLSERASRNRTTFTDCRQYVGQVTLRFDEAVSAGEATGPAVSQTRLPAGLTLELSLETPFDPARAAAGDVIEARLVRDVRRDGRLLAPKGARVHGRLRTVRQYLVPRSLGVLELELTRLQAPGLEAELRARLEWLGGIVAGARRRDDVVVSSSDKESAILFNGPLLRLPRGFRMQWRTL